MTDLKQRVKAILAKPYVRLLIPEEDGWFSGSIPEFPGCFAEEKGAKKTAWRLERVAESWLVAMLDGGKEDLIREPLECSRGERKEGTVVSHIIQKKAGLFRPKKKKA
jgi:predicted RNase H-like HicB family nuclease